MSKLTRPAEATLFCGIDVSAATLTAAVGTRDEPLQHRQFAKDTSGHKALVAWLHR